LLGEGLTCGTWRRRRPQRELSLVHQVARDRLNAAVESFGVQLNFRFQGDLVAVK